MLMFKKNGMLTSNCLIVLFVQYLKTCVECKIDIKGRNICNHSGRKTSIFELFDLGIPENTGMAITGYNSIGGYRAYAKPNNNHKRETLSEIVN
ncbi:unnamed protein product [Rhizophagus irregularis]|nr:unnamed protein product [Rhizophagus irregularis]